MFRRLRLVLSVGLLVLTMGTVVFAKDEAFFGEDEIAIASNSSDMYSDGNLIIEEGIIEDIEGWDYEARFLVTNISGEKINNIYASGSLVDENGVTVDPAVGFSTGSIDVGQSGYITFKISLNHGATACKIDSYYINGDIQNEVLLETPVYAYISEPVGSSDEFLNDEEKISLEQRIADLEERVAQLEEALGL